MIDHDRLFKELLSTFFLEFLELFFPELITYLEPNSLQPLDKEIFTDVTAGERYEADLIFKARFRNQDSFFLIHTEHQARTETNFSQRMFRYFARLYEKFAVPVYPIVLFSYDAPRRPEQTSHRVEFPDKLILDFNYSVIQLNRLSWRDFLQQENPVATALMAKMNIAPEDRPRVKLECLRLLATLRLNPAKMQLISGFVDTYLRLNTEEEAIFQAEIVNLELVQQEEVMEIVTSWMETGIQQGKIAVILRLLNRKIGTLEPELHERIRSLSITKLEDLAEVLLDFSNTEDLINWLNEQ